MDIDILSSSSSCVVFLSALIIICVLLSILYKHTNANTEANTDTFTSKKVGIELFALESPFAVESFNNMNYQDVKTKTLNWCTKMQQVGLLTPDQVNQCITTFKDASAGLIPKELKTPQTGMGRNYSLYNTQSQELTPDITGDNTNTIMLSTIDGLTLACKSDNSIYLVSNINDPNVEQNEMYFTLVPQNQDVYSILSPYGKYLIVSLNNANANANANPTPGNTQNEGGNTDYTAGFNGTSIGPMASWNITKINNTSSPSADNSNSVMLESLQFTNFRLVYDNVSKGLKIEYGTSDNMIWLMTSKLQNTDTNSGDGNDNFTGAEYYVAKENILQKIKTTEIQKVCLTAAIEAFTKLSSLISNNFNNIISYTQNKLNNAQRTFQLSTTDYQTRLNSINQNSMIGDTARASLISSIPPPSGLNISNDDITVAVNKIVNTKNAFLQNLQKQAILPLQEKLAELNSLNLGNDYNDYILSLKTEIDNTNNRINQNNTIMNRQKDTYNKINKNYAHQISKQKSIENTDKISNANIKMINNYSQQNSYLNKLYPIGIFILVIVLIYISYLTVIKFRDNIYHKY